MQTLLKAHNSPKINFSEIDVIKASVETATDNIENMQRVQLEVEAVNNRTQQGKFCVYWISIIFYQKKRKLKNNVKTSQTFDKKKSRHYTVEYISVAAFFFNCEALEKSITH